MVSILFLLLATLTATASLPSSSPCDFPIVGTSQRLVFQSLEETSNSGGDSISVTYDARGLPVSRAGGIGGLVGIRNYIPGSNYLVRSNGRGDVTEVRRTNGTVVASYQFSPWGQILNQTNTLNQSQRYSTRITHARSGYAFYLGRWYSPDIGLFLSRDIIKENGGLHLYQAFDANPVNNYDPDGRAVETIVDIASIGWSAVDLWRNPTWGNAGFLAWDIGAAVVPFVPGSYVAKAARLASRGKKCEIAAEAGTEVVQRAMSRAELDAIKESGVLSRGGRAGDHFVSDAVNSDAKRARQRLALPATPEVRVTLEVPAGTFSDASKVVPNYQMPGGGLERTAPGNLDIPVRVIDVLEY